MRTPISIALIAFVVLAPSLVWAQDMNQTAPPPRTTGGPPNVKPPTPAPDEPLPATPLVGGGETATTTTTSSGTGKVAAVPTGLSITDSSSRDILLLGIFVGTAILLIIGVGWYTWRRKGRAM